jgi:hypothetical protein
MKPYAVLRVKKKSQKSLHFTSRSTKFVALLIKETAESNCKMARDEGNFGGKFLGSE